MLSTAASSAGPPCSRASATASPTTGSASPYAAWPIAGQAATRHGSRTGGVSAPAAAGSVSAVAHHRRPSLRWPRWAQYRQERAGQPERGQPVALLLRPAERGSQIVVLVIEPRQPRLPHPGPPARGRLPRPHPGTRQHAAAGQPRLRRGPAVAPRRTRGSSPARSTRSPPDAAGAVGIRSRLLATRLVSPSRTGELFAHTASTASSVPPR